jgi:GNAT superfamily N-acetyltransferase
MRKGIDGSPPAARRLVGCGIVREMEQPIRIVEHTRDPAPVAAALLELRPHHGTAEQLAATLRELTRSQGLRVFGAHVGDDPVAAAAVTARLVENLAFGRFIYVDDLGTSASHRRLGLAGRLMDRIDELAEAAGVPGKIELDSGVVEARADAHSFYFSRGLRIGAYHFRSRDQR